MEFGFELLEVLNDAEKDVTDGRVTPMQDTFNDIRAMLKVKSDRDVISFYRDYDNEKTFI